LGEDGGLDDLFGDAHLRGDEVGAGALLSGLGLPDILHNDSEAVADVTFLDVAGVVWIAVFGLSGWGLRKVEVDSADETTFALADVGTVSGSA